MPPFNNEKRSAYDTTIPDPCWPKEDLWGVAEGISTSTVSTYTRAAEFVAENPHAPF